MNVKLVALIIIFLLFGMGYAMMLYEILKLKSEISPLINPPPLWYNELCLWLPLNGDFKDYSPKHHTLIPFGAPNFTGGIGEKAIYLDGVDDYISVPDSPEFSIVNNPYGLTISFWLSPATLSYPTQNKDGYIRFLGKGRPQHHEWCFTIYNGTHPKRANRISFYIHNATGGYGIGCYVQVPITVNEWIFIVGVIDPIRCELRIYKNGVLKGVSYNYSDPNNPLGWIIIPEDKDAPVNIGTRGDVPEFFMGRIDDVRIYSRALSDDEILALYRSYFANRAHLFQIYVGYNGKIASFQRSDTSIFYLNLTEALNDKRTIVAISVRGVRVSGSGGLYTYPNEGSYPLAIGHSSFSSWIIIKYGTNMLPLYQSVANDSWDVYCYGYVVEAELP